MTIFADIQQDPGLVWQVSCVDDISFSELATGTIQYLKTLPNGAEVAIYGYPVTAGTSAIGNGFYIEEQDRTSAIRVVWGASTATGAVVDVVGTLGSATTGERIINATSVTTTTGPAVPDPVAIRLSSLGGADFNPLTPGVPGSGGPNNVGLLVRTFGKVAQIVSSTSFKIDDGSGTPVLVTSSASVALGEYVGVTGVVVLGGTGSGRYPIVRTRTAGDVQRFGP